MTDTEYLEKVRAILLQFDEGAITDVEAVNAIIFHISSIIRIEFESELEGE